MIRAFLALPVPESILHRLTAVQHRLPLPRPLDPAGFHITLVFLDRQPESVLEDLHHAIAALALYPPLLRLDGLGTFGGDTPEALHVRIAGDARLNAIQMKTVRAARAMGIAVPARKFVPHVTLGRFRAGEAQPDTLARAMQAVEPVTSDLWLAEEMVLYRSTLRPEGPAYDALASYRLG
ncbi:MAG: RNA 2',3'-cyclic phosphodiesterase [Rhodobacter sp.]|uniref:RNA 2',3'-cyclic phosphodiesterase n=1 Tax=Pararhodobacter sp. TaxID=2127056 RepID=UPI001E16F8F3|nr:RNA 2',3'-cyclic phosphodiesterase [Pararhodobacter sp.]MCA8883472.1 RNA 2',3'-cyclic phosphodiesterase [Paracoccaceae bacterium]MCB1346567.1 RNA 2',3'-cyclic phosphodiesterase [Paracoccaceae bacterium]MCC0072000.1 RNA 2',3'-cyclic phosphodiesterase [Rhodobacter sp.]HPD93562.1 RNA 2',3'-cyclic phosphodiesterase [Pararhodobacter sp.]